MCSAGVYLLAGKRSIRKIFVVLGNSFQSACSPASTGRNIFVLRSIVSKCTPPPPLSPSYPFWIRCIQMWFRPALLANGIFKNTEIAPIRLIFGLFYAHDDIFWARWVSL